MPPRIPQPQYLHESLIGALYQLPSGVLLVTGNAPPTLASFTPTNTGTLIFRYGISYLIPPLDALVPGLFVSERGVALVGREAWDYMLTHCQIHPRADVIGFRTNSGDSQVFLRELDWGRPPRVLAYTTPESRMPIAEPQAVFVGEASPPLPEMLLKYLPAVTDLTPLLTA